MTESKFYLHIDDETGDLMVDWKLGSINGIGLAVSTPLKTAEYTREFFDTMREEMGLDSSERLVICASSDIDFVDDSRANDAAKSVIDEVFGSGRDQDQVEAVEQKWSSVR